ncbi:tigger transposable element-derived protein 1 [Nephila pilipes]|uniref:Tigger transposable element-derived protein 1 n=1 Tax=Nephila pilipes TaxID=299642 RepID=A0A8X6TMN2_NEPPI|nr:tigger transposable element-derived protein 1 [Nephila pilipes]
MDPKVKVKTGEKKKPKKMISMEAKHEIIAKHDRGVRIIDLANEYGRNPSTISTIIKQKEAIKKLQPSKGKQLAGDSVSEAIICEKAGAIFQDLKRDVTETERESSQGGEGFKASRGWFDNFKKRSGIHSVIRHGEASSGDIKAAENFIKVFEKLISEEGYLSQQVLNCDETGLFRKKMPRCMFITAEEKSLFGHKAMKDRLTLALCANAIGDFKIKPLLVYHSENPRAFKAYKVIKEKLQVLWGANSKAWVTRQFFIEWMNMVFGPSVKKYLIDNGLPLKCVLLLDNAPAHPPGLEDNLLDEFKFIKIVYLPPNTTSTLQPMDQQVISNFKKLLTKHLFKRCFEVTKNTNPTLREFWKNHYNIVICLKLIDIAWQGVTKRTLNSAWRKLWPNVVLKRDGFEGFEPIEEVNVSIGRSMGLEVDEADVADLIEEYAEELTTEELRELQKISHSGVMRELSSEEEVEPEEKLTSHEISDILGKWQEVSDFVEKDTQRNCLQEERVPYLMIGVSHSFVTF